MVSESETRLTGLAAAPGVALGPVLVYRPAAIREDRAALSPDAELGRLRAALAGAAEQLDRLAETAGDDTAPQ